jgi:hypothetical protein
MPSKRRQLALPMALPPKPPRPPRPPENEPTVDLSTGQLEAFIAKQRWVFAKTMPESPHEYCLRKASIALDEELSKSGGKEVHPNEERFREVVMHIRRHGYREKFHKSWYIRLDIDGWKYWTMGDRLSNTILINRTTLAEYWETTGRDRRSHQLP